MVQVGKDRDLNLNSVDRYAKASPHFVLEEHGHCEVPAGCGGAVLRWRNPATPLAVRLQLWLTAERFSAEIDGIEAATSRPLLPPGQHVLTIIVDRDDEPVQLLVTAAAEESDGGFVAVTPSPESLRWTDAEPRPWARTDPNFIADSWHRLTHAQLTSTQTEDYQVRKLLEAGGVPMEIERGTGRVWIRAIFNVPNAW